MKSWVGQCFDCLTQVFLCLGYALPVFPLFTPLTKYMQKAQFSCRSDLLSINTITKFDKPICFLLFYFCFNLLSSIYTSRLLNTRKHLLQHFTGKCLRNRKTSVRCNSAKYDYQFLRFK